MILLSMINKELKQFFRSTSSVIMLFIFPIVLITCLAFALKGLMGESVDIFKKAKVLYNIQDESKYSTGFVEFKKEFNKSVELTFEEIDNENLAREYVNKGEAIAFITIKKDGYDYFRSENGEGIRGKVFRSIFEQSLTNYALIDTTIEENPMKLDEIIKSESRKYSSEDSVGLKGITSFEYYTFAELALIILYISTTVSQSVYEEKKFLTINRIRMSKANDFQLILSKATVGVLIGVMQTILVYLYSTFILNVDWGNNLLMMFLVLISLSIFSSVLGIIVGLSIKDSKNMGSMLNTIIMFMCMLGGCYAPLAIIKLIPGISNIIWISPVYWVNNALISLNTGISDNNAIISIITSILLSLSLIIVYIAIRKVRRGKAIA
ncbi:ABC transporter permease [Clostridium carnis]